MAISVHIVTGSSVTGFLDDLASLRIGVFREFPYLYDGLREDELAYLKLYAEVPDAFAVIATDAGKVVGAATGMPLRHESRELTDPFAGTAYPVDEIFYVGELLFYPAYRNRGAGLGLVSQIVQHLGTLGSYRYLTCATVVRPEDHHLSPADYIPIDRFLAHTGFSPLPGITTSFTWRETDGVRRSHPMNFWIRELQADLAIVASGRQRRQVPDRDVFHERCRGTKDV